jgi:hypothetical protein
MLTRFLTKPRLQLPLFAATWAMSDDFSCMRFDHQISHLVAKFIKLLIISPFVGIIRSLPAFLLWQTHVGKIPTLVVMSFNWETSKAWCWGCANS